MGVTTRTGTQLGECPTYLKPCFPPYTVTYEKTQTLDKTVYTLGEHGHDIGITELHNEYTTTMLIAGAKNKAQKNYNNNNYGYSYNHSNIFGGGNSFTFVPLSSPTTFRLSNSQRDCLIVNRRFKFKNDGDGYVKIWLRKKFVNGNNITYGNLTSIVLPSKNSEVDIMLESEIPTIDYNYDFETQAFLEVVKWSGLEGYEPSTPQIEGQPIICPNLSPNGYPQPNAVGGCLNDYCSSNYNQYATCDNGSCNNDYGNCPWYIGCTNYCSPNFSYEAQIDDGSCLPSAHGCTHYCSSNYDPNAICDDGSCLNDNANC
jgi:hypothetical protein